MSLFATCTIANAILALCAPPEALTFSSWVCAVPLRFDTLASSRLERRIPSVCCRALRCVTVSRCNAGGSALLRACWPATPQRWCAPCLAADLARPCSCSCGRATSAAIFHGYRAPNCPCEPFDGFDQALAARHGSTDAARFRHSTVVAAPAIAFRTDCVMFAPAPQGSAPRCGLPPPLSTLRTIALQIHNNVCAGTCSCKIARLIYFAGHALTSSTFFSVK